MQSLLRLQTHFLTQFVALKYIYKMQFRAKLYLKYLSFCKIFKFQPIYAKNL